MLTVQLLYELRGTKIKIMADSLADLVNMATRLRVARSPKN